jgi:transcriptional regulator with XRE-family HTH domain
LQRLNAKRVFELRTERGWSQARLAFEAGLHPSSIRNYERGQNPGLGQIAALASALDTTVDALLTEDEPEPATPRGAA